MALFICLGKEKTEAPHCAVAIHSDWLAPDQARPQALQICQQGLPSIANIRANHLDLVVADELGHLLITRTDQGRKGLAEHTGGLVAGGSVLVDCQWDHGS
jgi:hypothetical protein